MRSSCFAAPRVSARRARPASFDMFCRPAAAYTAVSWSVDSRCGMSCSITAHFSTATDLRWPLSLASIIAVWPLLLSSSISAPSSSMRETICGQSCAPHSATSGVTPFSEKFRSAGCAFSTSACSAAASLARHASRSFAPGGFFLNIEICVERRWEHAAGCVERRYDHAAGRVERRWELAAPPQQILREVVAGRRELCARRRATSNAEIAGTSRDRLAAGGALQIDAPSPRGRPLRRY